MQQERIICPNCGAENSHYGECEYCGAIIEMHVATTPKQNDAESFAQKIAKYHKVESFIGGVAVVSIGEQYGVINERGDIVVPLSSSSMKNYGGRIGSLHKVVDSHGKILAEIPNGARGSIWYIGNGDFLISTADRQEILNKDNEHLIVNLPKGIRISGYESSLGYGCYIVRDDENKGKGIALKDKLLLPCFYEIRLSSDVFDRSLNEPKLIIINVQYKNYSGGIFDLEKREIILPCQYAFGSCKDKLLKVVTEERNYGVFDVNLQNLVVPPIYKAIKILDNRVCEVTKKGFFGNTTKTIQL